MAHGRILSDGPPQEVFKQEALLAEAHVEAPQISRLADAMNLPERIVDNEAFLSALQ